MRSLQRIVFTARTLPVQGEGCNMRGFSRDGAKMGKKFVMLHMLQLTFGLAYVYKPIIP